MRSNMSFSLKAIFATVSIAVTLVMLGVAIYFMTKSYNQAMQNESEKLFQQSKRMVQLLIDTKVQHLASAVESVSFGNDFFEAIESGDKKQIESRLLASMPNEAHFSAILTDRAVYEASYLLYETDALIQAAQKIQTATLASKMIDIEIGGETKLFFLSSKAAVDAVGKVVGIYVAAIELNSENTLISQIENNTALDFVCIHFGESLIMQSHTDLLKSRVNAFDTLIIEEGNIGYRTHLTFGGIKSELNICMALQSELLKQQHRDFIGIFIILLLFFFVLILLSIFVIQKIVAAPVEGLKDFAGRLAESHEYHKPPTVYIKEYQQLSRYLDGEISLKEIVVWAEDLIMDGFDAAPIETEIIYRLGTADAENFELSWEELAHMLRQLGYKARLELQAA